MFRFVVRLVLVCCLIALAFGFVWGGGSRCSWVWLSVDWFRFCGFSCVASAVGLVGDLLLLGCFVWFVWFGFGDLLGLFGFKCLTCGC